MSKILLNEDKDKNKNNILTLDPKQKNITVRKPINKIMNLDNFFTKNKISKSPRIFPKNSINYSKKAYISPTVSSFTNNKSIKYGKKNSPSNLRCSMNSNTTRNKNININYINPKISPVRRKYIFLKHNIKNELYTKRNNNNNLNIPKFKTTEKTAKNKNVFNFKKKTKSKKNNYKEKIIINKEKMNKKLDDNNIIMGPLIDYDSSDNNCSNSLRGKEKIKQYINENKKEEKNEEKNNIESDIVKDINININNKDMLNILMVNNNCNNKKGENLVSSNAFDVGSISHISKTGSNSIKDKNIEDETKTNNNNNKEFENIINDLIGEDNCKNLFKESKKQIEKDKDNIIQENIGKNIENLENNQDNEENKSKNVNINKENNKKSENKEEIIEINNDYIHNNINNKSKENNNIDNKIIINSNNYIKEKIITNNSEYNNINDENDKDKIIIKEENIINKKDIFDGKIKNDNKNNNQLIKALEISNISNKNDINIPSLRKELSQNLEIHKTHKSNNNLNNSRGLYKEFEIKKEYERMKYKTVKMENNLIFDNIYKNIYSDIDKSYENKINKHHKLMTDEMIKQNNNNKDNEKSYELNKQKNKSSYNDSSISHQINISIINGIFYLNESFSTYSNDYKEKEKQYKHKEKNFFISNKTKNLLFQKNNNYSFNETY